jgi:multicomponent Na+:H+ antiporter subunit E
MIARGLGLGMWSLGVWIALTWMFTVEQLAAGIVVAMVVAGAMMRLGPVARPWLIADPRRLFAAARLGAYVAGRMFVANVRLARRIWTPSLPLRSGMIVVATEARTEGGLTAVGLLTSLIVDNQLVDVDRRRGVLQYHAISLPADAGDPQAARAAINGPIERLVGRIVRATPTGVG